MEFALLGAVSKKLKFLRILSGIIDPDDLNNSPFIPIEKGVMLSYYTLSYIQ